MTQIIGTGLYGGSRRQSNRAVDKTFTFSRVGQKYPGRRIPIDLDAILANLALEEAEEELPQVVDSIPLDPEMLSEMA